MSRVYNFSAGPAVLPEEVLKEAQAEMLDYKGTGMSVMEMSHRSKAFDQIIQEAEKDLRDLMHIPDNYKVLFLQGGASLQFAMIPMNLMKNKVADYIVTGQWAKKAWQEAQKYGKANKIATSEDKTFSYIPDCSDLPISEDADYVYICENNTIYGTKFKKLPNTKGKDLVAECNGVITDMIVRCGVPKVSIGSEVAKGDILVEGRIPIYAEDGTVREYRPVTPDADIVLEHTGTFQAYLPADYIRKKYTGRQKTFYFIHFGDREWKPEKKMDFLQYDSVLEACPVKALEYLQIPCMVGRITYREYQKTEYYYTVSEAETVLQKKIMDFLETLDEKGVQIISKDVKIETKRAGWTAHGELLLREAAVSLVDSRAEDTGAEDLDRNED